MRKARRDLVRGGFLFETVDYESNWQEEVGKFRAWAKERVQIAEWECNYEEWQPLYEGVEQFVKSAPPHAWTAQQTEDLLYILARDWECQIISERLRPDHAEVAFHLAFESLEQSDWDARWQLADVLGHLPLDPRIEPLLLRFVHDEEEYVRRRALQSLTRIGSSRVETLAHREWKREDENQQWARMNALSCWNHINSPLLESHLREAEASDMNYLADYARRLRNGEVQPL